MTVAVRGLDEPVLRDGWQAVNGVLGAVNTQRIATAQFAAP